MGERVDETRDTGRPPGGQGRPDGRRKRWETHRTARRLELLQAVTDTVRIRGHEVDLDEVARLSGIAKSVFYRYFEDKADLWVAVGRQFAERVAGDVVRAMEGEREPRAMVAAAIEQYLRHVEQDPDLYRFVLVRQGTAAAAQDYSATVGQHASRLIGDILRAQGLDAGPAEPWGFALVGAVRSAAERWLDTRTMSRAALAAYLTDLAWGGLASADRSAGAPTGLPPAERR